MASPSRGKEEMSERGKRSGAQNIFTSNALGGSKFWHGIHKIKKYFKLGARFQIDSGTALTFSQDWWIGRAPYVTDTLDSSIFCQP